MWRWLQEWMMVKPEDNVGRHNDHEITISGVKISLSIDPAQFQILSDKLDAISDKLDKFISDSTRAVGFKIVLHKTQDNQGEDNMGKASRAKFKLDLSPDGQGGTFTLTPVDKAGLSPAQLAATVSAPVVTSSDPSAVTVDQSADASGLTGSFAIASPAKVASGVTLSATATDSADGSTLSGGPSEGINVVPGRAGGFKMEIAGS